MPRAPPVTTATRPTRFRRSTSDDCDTSATGLMGQAAICYKTLGGGSCPHWANHRIDEEVEAVDDVGDSSREALPPGDDRREPESNAYARREFLKKAAVGAISIPVAGGIVGSAAGRPSIRVRDRARSQFEGVTLQFAKAPFGTDEKDVIAKLLKPFETKTGITIKHTIVPWNVEGAAYATNYAGPNPYDVSYQTSTDLTSLGTKGVLEVINTRQWLNAPSFASTKAKFIPATIRGMTYQGKLWCLPCIIGGTVVFYNKDLLAKAGVTKIPTNTAELVPAAKKTTDSSSGTWGFSVPMTDKDFSWYLHYHGIHNRGGVAVSSGFSRG